MSYHIRDVLESARDTAPAPRTTTGDIIIRAGRIRARRRFAAATGAGAACLAVAVGGVAGLSSPPPAQQPAAQQPAAITLPAGFATVLGDSRVGDYRIGPVGEVTPGYQEVPVYRDGATWPGDDGKNYPLVDGTITVYQPGVYDPATFRRPDPQARFGPEFTVTVAGRPGVGHEITYAAGVQDLGGPSMSPSFDPAGRFSRVALAWQYAANAWATYVPRDARVRQSTEDAVAIAEALTVVPERPVRMPYRFGYLPQGWQPIAVTETPAGDSTTVSEVFLHEGPRDGDLATAVDEVTPRTVKVFVSRGDLKDDAIEGRKGVHCYAQPVCTRILGDYFIQVDGMFTNSLPNSEIRRITEGLKPVDVADHDAWVPATD